MVCTQRLGTAIALTAVLLVSGIRQRADPLIHEFVLNHTGADVNEFIEVFGTPGTDYTAFTLLAVEGDAGSTLGVIDDVFTAGTTDAGGFWTTGLLSSVLENGTTTLLLVEHFTGSPGTDLDADDDGVLDPMPPWIRLVDAVAVADGGSDDRAYAEVILTRGFDGNNATPGGASRFPNGTDTDRVADWLRNDFAGDGLPGFPDASPAASGEAVNTPGALNRPGFTPPPPSPPPGLLLNEIDADTPGTDTREFIELYDGGTGHTPLDDLVVVLFNGSTDASYRAFDLDGFSTDANGFFVLGGSEVVPPPGLILPAGTLQNGADAVALFAGDAVAFPNGTPVTTAFLVDAVVYATDDARDAGLLTLLHPGQPQVNENATGDKEGVSLQRLPNGTGAARATTAFRPFPPTPAGINGGADLALRQHIAAVRHDGAARSITFALRLTNTGPAPATGVVVTAHLPAGLSFVAASATQGDYAPETNAWRVGELVPDDVAMLHLTASGEATARLVRAEVTAADQPDPDSTPGDGRGDDAAVVALDRPPPTIDRFQADLRLAMQAAPLQARVGEPVHLTLSLTNDGPAATAGVAVALPLPDALTYVADSSDAYDPTEGLWQVGHLARGATKTLALTALITEDGTITATAEIIRNHLPDPDSYADNGSPGEDDQATVVIDAQASAKTTRLVPSPAAVPEAVWLSPNYPNPFTGTTSILFALPEARPVTLTIYDGLGRAVATLYNGPAAAGWHTVRWRASAHPSGLYIAHLQAGSRRLTRSMLRVR